MPKARAGSRFLSSLGRHCRAVGIVGGAIAFVLWSGFPSRVGVTASQARLSLPGDLLVPTAARAADRAKSFAASPAQLWPGLLPIGDLYREIWGRELELVHEEKDGVLVWRTVGAPAGRGASLSVCLLPAPDHRTIVHVRERYEDKALRHILATAAIFPGVWLRLRRTTPSK